MASRFDFLLPDLSGLVSIRRKPITDERGFFERLFCADELKGAGLEKPIAQINRSLTKKRGAVRGMHYQRPPHAETKIVSCLKGEIFDVAVDIRAGSPTFLQWHGEVLSADNATTLLIPEGFAHGFQTLSEECELLYLHTAPYTPHAEGALHPLDPELDIKWPLNVAHLSQRDASHEFLGPDFAGVSL